MKNLLLVIMFLSLNLSCLNIDTPVQRPSENETEKKLLTPSFKNVKLEVLNHCGPCHLGDQSQGGFSAETYLDVLKAVVPGDPEMSLLTFVLGPNGNMPPKAEKISDDKLELVKNWIKLGALKD